MSAPPSQALSRVTELLQELLGERWDEEQTLAPDTSLVYDLGLESMEVVMVLERLQALFPALDALRLLERLQADPAADLTLVDVVELVRRAEA